MKYKVRPTIVYEIIDEENKIIDHTKDEDIAMVVARNLTIDSFAKEVCQDLQELVV